MTTSHSPTASSLSSSNGVSGSSLPPFRSFLRMLNWRRDPAAEQRRMQLEKELALLDWMHSELDLIEADLPSSSTPPQPTAANSNDC
jgi:hypothetical protein